MEERREAEAPEPDGYATRTATPATMAAEADKVAADETTATETMAEETATEQTTTREERNATG